MNKKCKIFKKVKGEKILENLGGLAVSLLLAAHQEGRLDLGQFFDGFDSSQRGCGAHLSEAD